MPVDRYKLGGLFFSLTYEFARLERVMSKRMGLYSGQPRVLTTLKDNDGCTLSELSAHCGIGMPSLSVSVRNMAKTGLIRKDNSEKDSRAQHLFLTERGREKDWMFHEAIDQFYKEVLETLGERGSADAARGIEKITRFIQVRNEEELGRRWNSEALSKAESVDSRDVP